MLGWASRTFHSVLSPALPHLLSREEGGQALGVFTVFVFLSCFPLFVENGGMLPRPVLNLWNRATLPRPP